MNWHGLLFSAEMVRALLDNRKTQTRRPVTAHNSVGVSRSQWHRLDFTDAWVDPGPSPMGNPGPYLHVRMRPHDKDPQVASLETVQRVYPRIQPGDRIWVKETWTLPDPTDGRTVCYRADGDPVTTGQKWRASILMPRRFSRISLEVLAVRCQRPREITEADAEAEGVTRGTCSHPDCYPGSCASSKYRTAFALLWDKINLERGFGWQVNHPNWVYTFRRIG